MRQVSEDLAWFPDPADDCWDPEWDSDWEPPQDWAAEPDDEAGAAEPATPPAGWTGEGEAFAAGFLHRDHYRGAVDRVVTEVGSALNGKRKKFLALFRDPAVGTIVVEHRDRFARFGSEYVEAGLAAQDRRLAVIGAAEVDDDLVPDVTEILRSLGARLYGRRAAADRAARLAAIAAEPPAGDGG